MTSCDDISQERNKPIICFTFDDGHLSAYKNGLPLFQRFDYEATTFLNSGFIGKEGRVSWEQVLDQYANGWEVGGHTINHFELAELDDDEAYFQIAQDYNNFFEHGINLVSFALPAGHASERDYEIIKALYKNIRNSIDKEMHSPLNRFDLGYFVYLTEYDSEMVKERIIRGSINGEVLIVIGFHRISQDQTYAVDNCTPRELEEILSWVSEQDYQVMRFDKAIEKLLKDN